jgi:hypothetical protein
MDEARELKRDPSRVSLQAPGLRPASEMLDVHLRMAAAAVWDILIGHGIAACLCTALRLRFRLPEKQRCRESSHSSPIHLSQQGHSMNRF